MYKIYFNSKEEVIGINSGNHYCNYINIESLDINLDLKETKVVEEFDSVGRNKFIKTSKIKGCDKSAIVSSSKTEDFEDDTCIYTKKYKEVVKTRSINILTNLSKFSLKDIIENKKNQLMEKYKCSICNLYENFIGITGSGFISGNNGVILNSNSNIVLQDIECLKNSEAVVYCEADNEVDIYVNNKKVVAGEFFKVAKDKVSVEIKNLDKETNIFSFAILFK